MHLRAYVDLGALERVTDDELRVIRIWYGIFQRIWRQS